MSFKTFIFRYLPPAILLVGLIIAVSSEAGTVSPVQSTARPLGIDTALPVYLSGSDTAAAQFDADVLPLMQAAATTQLGESQQVQNLNSLSLDPNRMVMTEAVLPRIYFVGEGAGYHNSLLAQVIRSDGTEEAPVVIFGDASTSASYLNGSSTGARTSSTPLQPGDFVELGSMLGVGDRLALHLVANGARGGTYVYSTMPSLNADGLDSHVVSLAPQDDPSRDFLLIGFEDLFGGGDMDFNDLVVAVFYGRNNIDAIPLASAAPAPVPLPAPVFGLLAGLGLLRLIRRTPSPQDT